MKNETAIIKECEDYPMYAGPQTTVEDIDTFEMQMQEEFLSDESYVQERVYSGKDEGEKFLPVFDVINDGSISSN